MISIKFGGILLFNYNRSDGNLTCPYCNTKFDFNNRKLRDHFVSLIGQDTTEINLSKIIFRCILCAMNTTTYPFVLDDTFKPNKEQSMVIIELYQQTLITSQSGHINYLFLLSAPAGTGKTSTLMYLLKYPEYDSFKVVFSAPTNKALNVMLEKLGETEEENDDLLKEDDDILNISDDKRQARTFLTVFKLTNSSTQINSTGDISFTFQEATEISYNYDLIIIDEVSMMEKSHMEHLIRTIINHHNKGAFSNWNPILILTGDVAQLPPIKEESSVIFDINFQLKYSIKVLLLTEIMRSKDRLTDLSQNVRQLIPFDINHFITHGVPKVDLKKYNSNKIKYHTNRAEWLIEYTKLFKEYSNKPIILVYTNHECESLNQECRNMIFNYPKDKYVRGELLVFKNYYVIRRQKLTPGGTKTYFVKFFTSEQVVVDDVKQSDLCIAQANCVDIYGLRFEMKIADFIRSKVPQNQYDHCVSELTSMFIGGGIDTKNNKIMTKYESFDVAFNNLLMKINKRNHNYITNQLFINDNKLDKNDVDPTNCWINIISDVSIDKYNENRDFIKTSIRSAYNLLSRLYKTNKIMMFVIDYLFKQLWSIYYYRLYVWPFASVCYGYAITSHKSQGSTYNNTFVDVSNILGCHRVSSIVRLKSLYTSMTRASDMIHVLYCVPTIYPVISDEIVFKCLICDQTNQSKMYPINNLSVDKKCCDKVLDKIKPMCLYRDAKDNSLILSDKYKNLYVIPEGKLSEIHINDAYQYIIEDELIKMEIDKYHYSNILLARKYQQFNQL